MRHLILVALVLLVVPSCGRAPSRPSRAKHIVFITVDTLRRDRLGCYGGPNHPSPTIDRLAQEGIQFDDAYTPRGMTLPSMTSFFTSKYPHEHGVLDNLKQIPDDEWLLAERLKEEGFHSRAFNASGVLKPGRGNIEQGFDKYDEVYDEEVLTAKAVHYLQNYFALKGRREFLWVHFMSPHKPYLPPPKYRDQFTDPNYDGPVTATSDIFDRAFVEKLDLSPADVKQALDLYDGTVAFIDDCVNEIVTALDASGHREDTLVVFSTDHGEDLYSHQKYFYHANSIYASTTALALICRQPGVIPANQRVRGLVENVDFMPTVIGWLGLDPNQRPPTDADTAMRGTDLSDVLLGANDLKREFVVAQTGANIFSARNRDWHYVWNPDHEIPSYPPAGGEYRIEEEELYHLPQDPDEQNNLIGSNDRAVEALRAAIEAFKIRHVNVGVTLPDHLTVEKIQDLMQLNYISAKEGQELIDQLNAMRSRRTSPPEEEGKPQDVDKETDDS